MSQHAHLTVASDQRAARAAASPSRWCGRLHGDPRVDGLVPASHRERTERLVAHRAPRCRVGGGSDDDLPGLRRRLQPARGVDDVAHHRWVTAGAHGTHEHFTRVDPDPQRDVGRLIGRELFERLLHLQRGAHPTLRVVFVRDRDTEARDDCVADDLVELTAERAHVGDEPLERTVDEVLHLLGIGRLRESRETDDVGHQHGDEPALVGPGRERVTTLRAEPGGLGHAFSACRAVHGVRLPAQGH